MAVVPVTKTFTIIYHKTSSSSITDLTGTKWIFNNQISMSPLQGDEYEFEVNFFLTDDSTPGGGFSLIGSNDLYLEYINIDVAYYDDTWQNDAFKSITITGGTDATNSELIAWLQANATQVIESQPFSVVKFNNLTLGRINNHYLSTFNGVTVLSGISAGSSPVADNCLTFSSPNTFTLKVAGQLKYWDGTLQYSTDAINWSTWDGTTVLNSTSSGTTKYLYVRGSNNTYITGSSASSTKGKWLLTGSDISCDGNIETLLDYQTVANGNHPNMASDCYRYMFSNCTSLTTAPSLPATTLASNCYRYMFSNCTSLTTAPSLPATTLATYCYGSMFYSCTSLTTAPDLPATTLATYCYVDMFKNCTSLTVPAIMARGTTQATGKKGSCSSMYYGCTSLNIYTSSSGHTAFYKAITYSTKSTATNYRSSYQMFYNCKINGSTSTTNYLTAGTQYYY